MSKNSAGGSSLFRYIRVIAIFAGTVIAALVAWHFPKDVDSQESATRATAGTDDQTASNFYERVYTGAGPSAGSAENANSAYVEYNRLASHDANIVAGVAQFVQIHQLQEARVLEIGAGSGVLQDVVEDYTGLDIAASAARYFHKPFVQGSATDLPFNDNSFDSIWSVWVLEHVPNPERAMNEMRRVVRIGGILFFLPSWNVPAWAPEGLDVRPYRDLDWGGKLVKSTLSVRQRIDFQMSYRIPIRALRFGYSRLVGTPTALRYTRLNPNYDKYWTADSDAVNSLDYFESLLWFVSRGDECLNCDSIDAEIATYQPKPLIIKINKR